MSDLSFRGYNDGASLVRKPDKARKSED